MLQQGDLHFAAKEPYIPLLTQYTARKSKIQHVSVNLLYFTLTYDKLLLFIFAAFQSGGIMISAARKDMLEALKWSKKNSPVAYLVLSMNGKWGTPKDNALNIVAAFNRLWPETKAYLKTVATMSYKGGGKIISSEFEINYPQNRIKDEIHNDFFLLIKEMSKYMDEAEDYEAMAAYCRDMLDLFVWNSSNRDIWNGSIAYALDKLERFDEACQFYNGLIEKGELVASMYALSVLERCDVNKASEILEPYRGSDDKVITDRIMLLDQLKAVKR